MFSGTVGNLVVGTVSATSVDADGGVTVDNITIDGTEIDLSSGDLTVDVAGDLVLDAGGGNFKFSVGGTQILDIGNSSSDVVIKPTVDTKDIIFQQYDGTEVARIEDNATFNVVTNKLAINGTAITSTAAELNILDGVTSTATELNIVDGDTSAGTTAVAGGDGVVTNDGGTMRQTTVDTFDTYLSATSKTLTNKTLTSPQINTQVDMLARAELRFQDASGGQYVAFEAPATVSSSVTWVLPDADGSDGQVIKTDGSGTLSFGDAASSGFVNSTITTTPGSVSFDLTKANNSGSSETPFQDLSNAFATVVRHVYDLVEPKGASTSNNVDLGSSESYVGG